MSEKIADANKLEPAYDEASIVEYLRRDREFFLRHRTLLGELVLPHASGKTISLVEHQVAILRERNLESRRRLNELIQQANTNDTIFAKTRTLTLALLDASNLQALNEVLATHLLADFDADFVCCHLHNANFSTTPGLDHFKISSDGFTGEHLLNSSSAVCTTLRSEELIDIFPQANFDQANQNNETAASCVLLPLRYISDSTPKHDDNPPGFLCIGSRDAGHFSPEMDTLFMQYVADVLAKVIAKIV